MKIKLLYIDDERPNLMLFNITFRNEIDVITVSSAQEGLQHLRNDLEITHVICDLRMPQMDGIEFTRKAKEFKPDLSYYLLTGFDINEEIQSALDSKLIKGYFKKPYNKEQILAQINQ